MTAPVVVAGMTDAERDACVLQLAMDHEFLTAAEVIAEWIEWDWHGRFEELDMAIAEHPVNTAIQAVETSKTRPTVRDRMLSEFGGLQGDEDE